jgi:hypothetical protein
MVRPPLFRTITATDLASKGERLTDVAGDVIDAVLK